MPERINVTLYESNDETMDIVVYEEPEFDGQPLVVQDLTGATIEVYVKPTKETDDDDPGNLLLSTQTSGIVVTDAENGAATVTFPDNITPGTHWWKVDVILNGQRKTACSGTFMIEDT